MNEQAKIWRPRVTVASVAVSKGRFLMVEEMIDGQLLLNQPAGHLEDNESLTTAAIRECMEETGWSFEPEYLIGIYHWKHPASADVFLRFTFSGQLIQHYPDYPIDKDIHSSCWLQPEEIRGQATRMRSPLVMKSIDDYLAGHRYPLSLLTDIKQQDTP